MNKAVNVMIPLQEDVDASQIDQIGLIDDKEIANEIENDKNVILVVDDESINTVMLNM